MGSVTCVCTPQHETIEYVSTQRLSARRPVTKPPASEMKSFGNNFSPEHFLTETDPIPDNAFDLDKAIRLMALTIKEESFEGLEMLMEWVASHTTYTQLKKVEADFDSYQIGDYFELFQEIWDTSQLEFPFELDNVDSQEVIVET